MLTELCNHHINLIVGCLGFVSDTFQKFLHIFVQSFLISVSKFWKLFISALSLNLTILSILCKFHLTCVFRKITHSYSPWGFSVCGVQGGSVCRRSHRVAIQETREVSRKQTLDLHNSSDSGEQTEILKATLIYSTITLGKTFRFMRVETRLIHN